MQRQSALEMGEGEMRDFHTLVSISLPVLLFIKEPESRSPPGQSVKQVDAALLPFPRADSGIDNSRPILPMHMPENLIWPCSPWLRGRYRYNFRCLVQLQLRRRLCNGLNNLVDDAIAQELGNFTLLPIRNDSACSNSPYPILEAVQRNPIA